MRQPSKPVLLLAALVVTLMAVTQPSDASSLKLEQVVRALDALYKRQGSPSPPPATNAPSGTPPGTKAAAGSPKTSPSYYTGNGGGTYEATTGYYEGGSGSGYYSGEGGSSGPSCPGPRRMLASVRLVKDYMFIQAIRNTAGSFMGVCTDIFDWLNDHEEEETWADESSGFDSISDPVSGETGPGSQKGSGSGGTTASTPVKRNAKMTEVKRKLRTLKKQMDDSGSMQYDSGEYYGEQSLNDGDIQWHRLFLSCYVWLHLSDEYYYYWWKK